MNKETWTLALLISILLVVNSSFIVILQFAKYDTTPQAATLGGNIVKGILSQSDQLEVFSEPVLKSAPSNLIKKIDTSISTTTSRKPKQVTPTQPTQSANSNIRIVEGANGFKMTVDYDKDIVIIDGREIPIIIDGNVNPSPNYYDTTKRSSTCLSPWIHLTGYERFDVCVEPNYYNNNSADLTIFLNEFEERYNTMEQITGWSAEEFVGGNRLYVYIEGFAGCWSGWAIPGEAHLFLQNDFSNPNFCNYPYYDTFNGTPLFGNPGEFGDRWVYMAGMLHESLHAINPLPIIYRLWLTEGWSEYYMYNILALLQFNDINQITADTYIYKGNSWYNWESYKSNDYHDTCDSFCATVFPPQPMFAEIQFSKGYDITAWMFSMMRDIHNLDWADFYTLIENNPETMQKVWDLRNGAGGSVYYTDTHVIDLFGRASGLTNFETQTKPIWMYNTTSSPPGWGVRNFTNLSFYADLMPLNLTYPSQSYFANISGYNTVNLTAVVGNFGGTSLQNVSVRFYVDPPGATGLTQISEQLVNVSAGTNVNVLTSYVISTSGNYTFEVRVDENNIKIESNDGNNAIASSVLNAQNIVCGDVNADGTGGNILDLTYVVNYIFRGGPQAIPPKRGDVNADGTNTNILDLTYLVNRIFRGGPDPIGPIGCIWPGSSPVAEPTEQELADAEAMLKEVGISV